MSARENILARIRAANKAVLFVDVMDSAVADRLASPPISPLPTMDWDIEERFKIRCQESASTLDEIKGIDELPLAVTRYLSKKGLPTKVVCWPDFVDLPWSAEGIQMESRSAIGDDKVGLTGSYCAVAETGTLVLLSGQESHATTSLLPETHIAVIRRSRIVKTMEDAWRLIRGEVGSLPRQVSFISGPSRTADIEMTLVYGAHGPFRVHVIIIDR
ncbi:MAG: lactate utilization protein C [Proteobacteria bacterium]|nr:lactate utilization protein C [Pseudomonadota bacterium]MDA1331001.1 lactate utilization protein C [Pseudomonadota bacterium]